MEQKRYDVSFAIVLMHFPKTLNFRNGVCVLCVLALVNCTCCLSTKKKRVYIHVGFFPIHRLSTTHSLYNSYLRNSPLAFDARITILNFWISELHFIVSPSLLLSLNPSPILYHLHLLFSAPIYTICCVICWALEGPSNRRILITFLDSLPSSLTWPTNGIHYIYDKLNLHTHTLYKHTRLHTLTELLSRSHFDGFEHFLATQSFLARDVTQCIQCLFVSISLSPLCASCVMCGVL